MYIKRSVILIVVAGLLAIGSFAASAFVNQQAPQQANVAAPLAGAMRQYALAERYGESPVQVEQATCPVIGVNSLSTQQLRAMLDARYLYRVGQPR